MKPLCYRLHILATKASTLQYGVLVTYFTLKKTPQKTRNSYLFNVWKKISLPIPGLLWVLPSSAGSAGSTVTLVPVCLMNCCRLTCLSSLVSCSRSCCMSFNKKKTKTQQREKLFFRRPQSITSSFRQLFFFHEKFRQMLKMFD